MIYTYTMPKKHYCSKPTSLRCHLMAKRCLRVGKKSENLRSEARNLPTWGCKSMLERLIIMLGVFIIMIYIYTMPNKHYCSKPTSLRCHLMAKHCLRVGKNQKISRSEARNLPTWGCKSMLERLIFMLGVFIIMIYTYTMPNKHYCSKPTSLRCHLMAKHCLRVGKKSENFEI